MVGNPYQPYSVTVAELVQCKGLQIPKAGGSNPSRHSINTSMRVDSVTNIIGWENNRRISETRTTYHYKSGPDVTTVAKRSEEFNLYTPNGVTPVAKAAGTNIDIKV